MFQPCPPECRAFDGAHVPMPCVRVDPETGMRVYEFNCLPQVGKVELAGVQYGDFRRVPPSFDHSRLSSENPPGVVQFAVLGQSR